MNKILINPIAQPNPNPQRYPGFRDQGENKPPQQNETTPAVDYVFRGELLDSITADKRYRPQYNQQVSPEYRDAILQYRSTGNQLFDENAIGRLIDRFV